MTKVDADGEGDGLARRLGVIGRATVAVAGERSLSARLQRIVETATALIVYRVVREVLTSVARHARATAADVMLRIEGDHLIVTVRDDEHGFAVGDTLRSRERGLGLFGIRERAQLADGYLDLRGIADAGTTVPRGERGEER